MQALTDVRASIGLDGVTTYNEFAVQLVARLAERLGLPGACVRARAFVCMCALCVCMHVHLGARGVHSMAPRSAGADGSCVVDGCDAWGLLHAPPRLCVAPQLL
jgi:hypothetical protein